jgi:hypothetical protein
MPRTFFLIILEILRACYLCLIFFLFCAFYFVVKNFQKDKNMFG